MSGWETLTASVPRNRQTQIGIAPVDPWRRSHVDNGADPDDQ